MLTIEISPAAAGSRASNLKTIIYNPNRGNLLSLRVYFMIANVGIWLSIRNEQAKAFYTEASPEMNFT